MTKSSASASFGELAQREAAPQPSSPILVAICSVMNEVHGLQKSENNAHGGYKYVSVDAFKAMVRPLMAKHGLSLLMTEVGFKLVGLTNSQGKVTMHARITYALQLRHISGTMEEEERVTIVLPLTGAQTAGAAKSYVLKEYLKARFMVATGDKDLVEGGADADAYQQQEYGAKGSSKPAATTAALPAPAAPATKPSVYAARKAGLDKDFVRIEQGINEIETSGTMEDLALFWKSNQAAIAALPQEWTDHLTKAKNALKKLFEDGASRSLSGMGVDPEAHRITDGPHTGDKYDPETGEVLS